MSNKIIVENNIIGAGDTVKIISAGMQVPAGVGAVDSVFGRTGVVTAQSGDYTTAQVTENANLYFTNARAIGATISGYVSGAGTVAATDTVLQAIQKLNGNAANQSSALSLKADISGQVFTGAISATNLSGTNTGDQTDVTGNAGTVTTINGRISAGTNVTLGGAGTAADPYVINSSGGGGSGDVVGPASATDNAVARYDGTTGKLIQGSTVTVADTGALAVTSGSPIAFAVGANGATNPALTVDASTASSATGVAIKSAASGGGVTITASSSATNESLTLACKGFAGLNLNGGTGFVNIQSSTVVINSTGLAQFAYSFRGYTSNTAYSFIGLADSNLTAGAECLSLDFNFAQTKTHSAGAIAIQRDVRFRPSKHAFSAASTITDAAGFAVDGAPIAGTNATLTNSSTIYSAGSAVGSGVTNSYGLNITANTGATNNWAARFVGDVRVDNGAIKETRINRRVVALTDAATVTPNSDTTDVGILTTLSQNSTIANPTGTPVDGQQLMLRIKSSAARTLTFGTQYRGSTDLALPASTSGGGLTDYLGFVWNSADSKWDYLAKNFGY